MAGGRTTVSRLLGRAYSAGAPKSPFQKRLFVTLPYPGRAAPKRRSYQVDRSKRLFNASSERPITGQEAPSAQAYIKSGALKGNQDLVDVKKVLVIGSGGLSIGQAGEFDYSGGLHRDTHEVRC